MQQENTWWLVLFYALRSKVARYWRMDLTESFSLPQKQTKLKRRPMREREEWRHYGLFSSKSHDHTRTHTHTHTHTHTQPCLAHMATPTHSHDHTYLLTLHTQYVKTLVILLRFLLNSHSYKASKGLQTTTLITWSFSGFNNLVI